MNEPAPEPSPPPATSDEELLGRIADDFAARRRRGEHPTVDEYTVKYPPLTERIRKVLAAAAMMEQTVAVDRAAGEQLGSTIGRYKLLERIGEGGFGVVYMAEQVTPLRRRVALKVLKPGMDSRQVLARFEAERQALALMDHPNIAKVLDAGSTEAGRPYFVMEIVRGSPITDYCDKHQLSTRDRLELFAHVCHAVQHAHGKGIIHRDLKPSNVLVTVADDGKPVPKVIDFGIAKATAGQRLTDRTLFTEFRQLLGTPLYMSPEQAESDALADVDTRSDVYALGVMLYELLTGGTPFEKERLARAAYDEVRRIIRDEEPPRPSTRLGTLAGNALTEVAARRQTDAKRLGQLVRGELDWVVMKALEKERARRYATANELARDVERYLADEPVEACPPSRLYRLRKVARRHRAALSATAAFVLLLVLAVVISTWQAVRATHAERMVIGQRDQVRDALGQREQALERAGQSERTAKERLATQLVALGDAAVALGRTPARDHYREAIGLARELRISELPADTGLLTSYLAQPPPLMGDDGKRGDIGGFARLRGSVSVQFMPDGLSALSASGDGTIAVWDTATGAARATFQHEGQVFRDLAVSADGKTALTGSEDGTVKLWDVVSGKLLRSFRGHEKHVSSVAFSHDNQRAVSGGTDKTVRVWDVASGTEICRLEAPSHVYSVAFSPDGQRVLSGGEPDAIVLWDLTEKRAIHTISEGSVSAISSVAFSPDGRTALSGSLAHGVTLWDLATGKALWTCVGHTGPIYDLAFLPDGRSAVSVSDDSTVRLWDVETGRQTMVWRDATSGIRSLSLSRDGRFALCGGAGAIKLWNLQESRETPTLRGHTARVVWLAPTSDGRIVLSASFDNTIRLWDVATGLTIRTIHTGPSFPWGVCLTRDGTRALSSHEDGTITLWDMRSGGRVRTVKAHSDVAGCVTFSPDARTALSCSSDGTIKLWDLDDFALLRTFTGHASKVRTVTFSADGKAALSASHDGTIKLWDLVSAEELHTFAGHRHWIHNVAFAPDGRTFVSGGWDYQFGIWDVEQRRNRYFRRPSNDVLLGLAFSADGKLLFTGSMNGNVSIWDVANGARLRDLRIDSEVPDAPASSTAVSGHNNGITSVVFCRDDSAALAASRNGSIRRWEFELPARYAEFTIAIPEARDALTKNPHDPQALETFGRWYAFRGVYDRAAELLEKARDRGGDVSSLELARCYWKLDRRDDAAREFEEATRKNEAPRDYLELCRSAVIERMRVEEEPVTTREGLTNAAAELLRMNEKEQPASPTAPATAKSQSPEK